MSRRSRCRRGSRRALNPTAASAPWFILMRRAQSESRAAARIVPSSSRFRTTSLRPARLGAAPTPGCPRASSIAGTTGASRRASADLLGSRAWRRCRSYVLGCNDRAASPDLDACGSSSSASALSRSRAGSVALFIAGCMRWAGMRRVSCRELGLWSAGIGDTRSPHFRATRPATSVRWGAWRVMRVGSVCLGICVCVCVPMTLGMMVGRWGLADGYRHSERYELLSPRELVMSPADGRWCGSLRCMCDMGLCSAS
jgi:hypothetical protein